MKIDPIHQFNIEPIVTLGHIGKHAIAITNSTVYMFVAVGLRLSSELVAGVLVGAALGWGFDRLLSTSPWGLIVFLLLGFTAGVLNVMRTAGVMAKQSERL